jgi:hypothetical protein
MTNVEWSGESWSQKSTKTTTKTTTTTTTATTLQNNIF